MVIQVPNKQINWDSLNTMQFDEKEVEYGRAKNILLSGKGRFLYSFWPPSVSLEGAGDLKHNFCIVFKTFLKKESTRNIQLYYAVPVVATHC